MSRNTPRTKIISQHVHWIMRQELTEHGCDRACFPCATENVLHIVLQVECLCFHKASIQHGVWRRLDNNVKTHSTCVDSAMCSGSDGKEMTDMMLLTTQSTCKHVVSYFRHQHANIMSLHCALMPAAASTDSRSTVARVVH